MSIWLRIRYLVARFTFFALRLPIDHLERKISYLWRLTKDERAQYLSDTLRVNQPTDSKGIVVRHLFDLRERPSLTKAALKTLTQSRSQHKARFSRHTAGTTGEPTNIFLSRKELAQMLAVRDYCYRNHGFKLGHREARIWGRPDDSYTSKLRDFLLNRRIFYTVEADVEKTIENLISWKPDYIYGYTSLILELAELLIRRDVHLKGLKGVVCTAEMVLPAHKRFLRDAFQAPVLEEYGSTEFDVIAFECENGHLHLVNPWLWIETEHNTAMITDVSRKSQHMIRYEIGDTFRLAESGCALLGDTTIIEDLLGRTTQQFAFVNPGYKFHSVVFSRALDSYMRNNEDCFKFSVKQTDFSKFEVYLSNQPKLGESHFQSWLTSYLKDHLSLSNEFQINISIGEAVGQQGKHSYFIQDINQTY